MVHPSNNRTVFWHMLARRLQLGRFDMDIAPSQGLDMVNRTGVVPGNAFVRAGALQK
jgi:hypothetical protein